MRVKMTMINSTFNILSQVIQLILSFIIRNLFIKYIGIELLGLSGLFTNILSALNLADLGVGAAITFYLYRPMAEKDLKKVKGLMSFYKKTYYLIGSAIIIIGLILLPFIQYFIKDQNLDLSYIRVLFLIQLAGTASTYFLAYKRTLLFVDQKGYIASIVDSTMNILMMIVRVGTLVVFKSYVTYLAVILIQNILSNVIITIICGRIYPFLKTNHIQAEYIDRKTVVRDLKNIIVEKIVGYIHYSTDNIIISRFIGLASAGFLANYTLIFITVQTFIVQITSAIQASFGNFVNSGYDEKEVYTVYKRFSFLCYLCSSFSITSFLILIQPFIILWLEEKKYLLPYQIILILCMTFFISTMRIPLVQMVSIYGLFKEMKYLAIVSAITNLTISIILVQYIGIAGTLIGTMISELIYWAGQTYYVINRKIKVPINKPVRVNLKFIATALIAALITMLLSGILFKTNTIITFIGKIILCILVPNTANILIYRRTEEYAYYKQLFILAYNKGYAKIKK